MSVQWNPLERSRRANKINHDNLFLAPTSNPHCKSKTNMIRGVDITSLGKQTDGGGACTRNSGLSCKVSAGAIVFKLPQQSHWLLPAFSMRLNKLRWEGGHGKTAAGKSSTSTAELISRDHSQCSMSMLWETHRRLTQIRQRSGTFPLPAI